MENQNVIEIIKLIWPLVLLQYALAIWAIVDMIKKKKTKNLNLIIWIIVCLFINIFGPILYFLVGRAED